MSVPDVVDTMGCATREPSTNLSDVNPGTENTTTEAFTTGSTNVDDIEKRKPKRKCGSMDADVNDNNTNADVNDEIVEDSVSVSKEVVKKKRRRQKGGPQKAMEDKLKGTNRKKREGLSTINISLKRVLKKKNDGKDAKCVKKEMLNTIRDIADTVGVLRHIASLVVNVYLAENPERLCNYKSMKTLYDNAYSAVASSLDLNGRKGEIDADLVETSNTLCRIAKKGASFQDLKLTKGISFSLRQTVTDEMATVAAVHIKTLKARMERYLAYKLALKSKDASIPKNKALRTVTSCNTIATKLVKHGLLTTKDKWVSFKENTLPAMFDEDSVVVSMVSDLVECERSELGSLLDMYEAPSKDSTNVTSSEPEIATTDDPSKKQTRTELKPDTASSNAPIQKTAEEPNNTVIENVSNPAEGPARSGESAKRKRSDDGEGCAEDSVPKKSKVNASGSTTKKKTKKTGADKPKKGRKKNTKHTSTDKAENGVPEPAADEPITRVAAALGDSFYDCKSFGELLRYHQRISVAMGDDSSEFHSQLHKGIKGKPYTLMPVFTLQPASILFTETAATCLAGCNIFRSRAVEALNKRRKDLGLEPKRPTELIEEQKLKVVSLQAFMDRYFDLGAIKGARTAGDRTAGDRTARNCTPSANTDNDKHDMGTHAAGETTATTEKSETSKNDEGSGDTGKHTVLENNSETVMNDIWTLNSFRTNGTQLDIQFSTTRPELHGLKHIRKAGWNIPEEELTEEETLLSSDGIIGARGLRILSRTRNDLGSLQHENLNAVRACVVDPGLVRPVQCAMMDIDMSDKSQGDIDDENGETPESISTEMLDHESFSEWHVTHDQFMNDSGRTESNEYHGRRINANQAYKEAEESLDKVPRSAGIDGMTNFATVRMKAMGVIAGEELSRMRCNHKWKAKRDRDSYHSHLCDLMFERQSLRLEKQQRAWPGERKALSPKGKPSSEELESLRDEREKRKNRPLNMVFFGNGSFATGGFGYAPIPKKGLVRHLCCKGPTVLLDEYRTSQQCPCGKSALANEDIDEPTYACDPVNCITENPATIPSCSEGLTPNSTEGTQTGCRIRCHKASEGDHVTVPTCSILNKLRAPKAPPTGARADRDVLATLNMLQCARNGLLGKSRPIHLCNDQNQRAARTSVDVPN